MIKDITGKRFGLITAISISREKHKSEKAQWNCLCDCGSSCVVEGARLREGVTKSCGCLKFHKIDPRIRFWSRVSEANRVQDCWEWIGRKNKRGYGVIDILNEKPLNPKKVSWKGKMAHAFAYEDVIGAIPEGTELHHECKNTGCVNPFHLMPVTSKEHRFLHRVPTCNRKHPNEPNPVIYCACGCGAFFNKFCKSNRPRRYVHGHWARTIRGTKRSS